MTRELEELAGKAGRLLELEELARELEGLARELEGLASASAGWDHSRRDFRLEEASEHCHSFY